MKKILTLLSLLILWNVASAALYTEVYELDFPMTLHWRIKVWDIDLWWWVLKIFDGSWNQISSFNITTPWNYGSEDLSTIPLMIYNFSWYLNFKAEYNWKNYIIDRIITWNLYDSVQIRVQRWQATYIVSSWPNCPKDWSKISFVPRDCRYDLILKEDTSSPSNPWWWGWWWGGWWWGWWGGGSSDTPKTSTANTWTTVNTWTVTTVNTWDNNKETKTEETTTQNNNTNNSWYQEGNQSEILSNWYSRELNNAYAFAYKNWITTMSSIDKANMNWPLNRIAMAKMLSNYAINVLWKKPTNIVVPNFPDVSSQLNEDYGWAVTLAYQLWIMWLNIDKFRPYDEVTRAEFGTALSRMLYWLKDGNPYYSTHLTKLKAERIISNDNPNLKELRWYVMLMLMRSAMNN